MVNVTSFAPRLHIPPHRLRLRTAAARTTPTLTPCQAAVAVDGNSQYLRRWIAHQAVLYNDLLKTIASAPCPPAGPRA